MCKEIITVFSQIKTKHRNTIRKQTVDFLNAETRGTYSNHWVSKGQLQDIMERNDIFLKLIINYQCKVIPHIHSGFACSFI